MVSLSRAHVTAWRVHAQQLDSQTTPLETAGVLDIGAQDSRFDGGLWALANRGMHQVDSAELVTLWTIRGAPHLYRRRQWQSVVAATAPYSSADAAKRIASAATPLRHAGIDPLAGLATVAKALRQIVTEPMVKGEVSARLTKMLPEPYLRYCQPCAAVHCYELTFRLGATQAGLELLPGTSPPVLSALTPASSPTSPTSPASLDPIRGYLRLFGPATPAQVAAYLDAPVRVVRAHWPSDAEPVQVDGSDAAMLAEDVAAIAGQQPVGEDCELVRLLGPMDLYLQSRDRELVVPDPASRKQLWPTLGRPGAILAQGDILGLWRPRASGSTMNLAITWWTRPESVADQVACQADLLARARGLRFGRLE